MLYNIKPLHLHCVFHGIRFKVNKDWLSGIDSLLFFIYLLAIPLFMDQRKNLRVFFFKHTTSSVYIKRMPYLLPL